MVINLVSCQYGTDVVIKNYHLARILRLLATHHIFDEITPDVFSNNRHSIVLDTGKAINDIQERPEERYDMSSGLSALVCHVSVLSRLS